MYTLGLRSLQSKKRVGSEYILIQRPTVLSFIGRDTAHDDYWIGQIEFTHEK